MVGDLRLFIDSLEIKFLDIRRYDLDSSWEIDHKLLKHSVLWLLLHGEIRLELDQAAYEAKAGDVLLFPGHSVLSASGVTPQAKLISVNFDAHIPLLGERNWTQIIPLPVRAEQALLQLAPIAEEMLAAARRPAPGSRLLLQAGALRLAAVLIDLQGDRSAATEHTGVDRRILAVIARLAARPDWFPQVAEMAEMADMSVSHFGHLFRLHTGQSPLDFLHACKISEARRRLVHGQQPVSAIAYELGFQDANYFSRLFRRLQGQSPQAYRKRHQLLDMQIP
ncbi:MAG: AraC family transcriptional regulator [Paenibacillaceae bacterium]|nr:AraC family transcriptional regulator [Paenibacillaceae bacterium]